ncbi:MAG: alpha-amylase [Abditibacteriota bacterium]|nr:alpha-amylase [Abditibacteriota bacterium]
MNIIAGLHVTGELRQKNIAPDRVFDSRGRAFFSADEAADAAFALNRETGAGLSGSEIYLAGLLEALKLTLLKRLFPSAGRELLAGWTARAGSHGAKELLTAYVRQFPPEEVFRKRESPGSFLAEAASEADCALGLLMVSFALDNPAYSRIRLLFDTDLTAGSAAESLQGESRRPRTVTGGAEYSIADILSYGSRLSPDSLPGQLTAYQNAFGAVIGDFAETILRALDYYREETRPPASDSPGEALVPSYGEDVFLAGEENYSRDAGWMPRVVMIAKNARVWLWQLARKYDRPIERLDQIPTEELESLARSGFNALWLIGLWDRGEASRTIKRWSGNPEADSSAYSIRNYTVSSVLGGDEALEALKRNAAALGIRLASDMVPNHTSLDSPLLVEHPDYYLQTDSCPYPNYTFSGESLSGSDRYGVFLEDHYFDRTDAAVVFKYRDYSTGRERYIYHGNDGTGMPWNDTAQLDYLKPEVRQYVSDTIIRVARQFPVIRFDAAMTLTKKHFQRLWYPEPGTGGDIPTRSARGLSKAEFDAVFPEEFWRSVVDRVAAEAPDTLLLAEAFWLLEGYFVRTLGMHRVYNSAFMNMLRDGDNAKYRELIRKTLEFDPEILERYVNFMSNPDEKTAVEQFGRDDRYFGACVLMCTMPGLPMFAHGQTEGLTEKYGMEYARPYYDESPDEGLAARHEREIFPLLKRRSLFAGSGGFRLYTFETAGGADENVFAYTNKAGGEAALVVFNNRYGETEGAVRESCPVKNKETGALGTCSVTEGLGLAHDPDSYVIYRDMISGREYIVRYRDLAEGGFRVSLKAYKYAVFTDFRQVRDNEFSHYAMLTDSLQGRGTESVEADLAGIRLGPVRELIQRFTESVSPADLTAPGASPEALMDKLSELTATAADYQGGREHLDGTRALMARTAACLQADKAAYEGDDALTGALIMWLCFRHLGSLRYGIHDPAASAALLKEWAPEYLWTGLLSCGEPGLGAGDVIRAVELCIRHEDWTDPVRLGGGSLTEALTDLLSRDDAGKALKLNRYGGVVWFNREAFDFLRRLMHATGRVIILEEERPDAGTLLRMADQLSERLGKAAEKSGYRMEKLMSIIGGGLFK